MTSQCNRHRLPCHWQQALPPLLFALVTLIAVNPLIAFAQGEHARRVAAELRVLTGDIRRLGESSPDSPVAKGLVDRINGNMSMLEVLMRFADNELRLPPSDYSETISALRHKLEVGDYPAASTQLSALLEQYPLRLKVPDTAPTRAQALQAEQIHTSLCMACHDQPVEDAERPAYNLYKEANDLAPDEFIARMLVGVKGDSVTGIDNPLTDIELANLVQYYRTQSSQ